jgi:hypothetical protein
MKKRVELNTNEFGVVPADIWDRHLNIQALDHKGAEYNQILL